MFDLAPPPGIPGLVWTILAYVGAFGILFALIWVNVLIAGLVNGMVLLGVSEFWQTVIKGSVIVVAVIVDQLQQRMQQAALARAST